MHWLKSNMVDIIITSDLIVLFFLAMKIMEIIGNTFYLEIYSTR